MTARTYLPYPDFVRTARSLSTEDLNKQILDVVSIFDGEYSRMWDGHSALLAAYGVCMCEEMRTRESATAHDLTDRTIGHLHEVFADGPVTFPSWLGDPGVHISHQAELLRLDPDHYNSQFPDLETRSADGEFLEPKSESFRSSAHSKNVSLSATSRRRTSEHITVTDYLPNLQKPSR